MLRASVAVAQEMRERKGQSYPKSDSLKHCLERVSTPAGARVSASAARAAPSKADAGAVVSAGSSQRRRLFAARQMRAEM